MSGVSNLSHRANKSHTSLPLSVKTISMEGGQAPASSLSSLISGFNARIADLQELVIARSMSSVTVVSDLYAVDASVKAMELQVQTIKNQLREEILAIPKAKSIVDASLKQHKKLQEMGLQEKKDRGSPPVWYISSEELDSLSSYMKGRLTLEKVNAAISDMATYAEATAQLVSAPRKKLTESMLEKALERRDIAMTEGIKGKHFFLESDMKGPTLKLDNTGKAILTVLRHLGRISEMRVGHHRVIILSKP
ncbi:hypothetical protein V2J09_004027 [Rumex salicifolius]